MGLCLETETEELLIKVTAVLYIGSGINIYISFYIIWFFIIRFDLCTKRLQRWLDYSSAEFFHGSQTCSHRCAGRLRDLPTVYRWVGIFLTLIK